MASDPISTASLASSSANLGQLRLESDVLPRNLQESQANFNTLMAQLKTAQGSGPASEVIPGTSIQPADLRLDNTLASTPVQAYIPPDTGVTAPSSIGEVQATGNVDATTYQNTGDTIINNLNKVRQAFDQQEARLEGFNAQNLSGTSELLAIQVELVKYSLLIDVTSKLTGKATQAVDVLMKGQ